MTVKLPTAEDPATFTPEADRFLWPEGTEREDFEIETIFPITQQVIKGTTSWEIMLPADLYEAGKLYAFRVTEGDDIKYYRAMGERRGDAIVFDLLKAQL